MTDWLFEYRCTLDDIIAKIFALRFKMAECFENLNNILRLGDNKVQKALFETLKNEKAVLNFKKKKLHSKILEQSVTHSCETKPNTKLHLLCLDFSKSKYAKYL